MENKLLERAKAFLKAHHNQNIWYRIMCVLASLVVFVTTYMLILPAITMEKETYCGLEEHIHTEDCYQLQENTPDKILDCTYGTLQVHQHTDSCYDENNHLICDQAAYILHTHDANCYNEGGVLVCTLPEIKAHQHTDSCYLSEQVLVCGQQETAGHTHDSGCYTKERGSLICAAEEHAHSEACYDENGNLVCGLQEHQHQDDCYQWAEALTCGQTEQAAHTHSAGCYETRKTLICGYDKLKVSSHQHTEACFREGTAEDTKILVCGMTEHQHSEVCYQENAADLLLEQEAQNAGLVDEDGLIEDMDSDVPLQADGSLPEAGRAYGIRVAALAEESGGEETAAETGLSAEEVDAGSMEETEISTETEIIGETETEQITETEIQTEMESESETETASEEATEQETENSAALASDTEMDEEETETEADGLEEIDLGVMLFETGEEETLTLLAGTTEATNLKEYITSVTTKKLVGGRWVTTSEFVDGDSIQLKLNYTIPANTVEGDSISYTFPDGITIPDSELNNLQNIPITQNGITVGHAKIVKGVDGTYKVIITFNTIETSGEGIFNPQQSFSGNFQLQATVSAGDNNTDRTMNFGGNSTSITIKHKETGGETTETKDLSVSKEGTVVSMNADGTATIQYTIVAYTTYGSDGPVTLRDEMRLEFVTDKDGQYAPFDENSFKLYKISAEGSKEVSADRIDKGVVDVVWNGKTVEFVYQNLEALGAGESYVLTYSVTVKVVDGQENGGNTGIWNVAYAKHNETEVNSGTQNAWLVPVMRVSKSGSLDQNANRILWTITVSNAGGYILKDVLGDAIKNVSMEEITITGGELNGSLSQDQLTSGYKLPSNDQYTIKYYTDVSEVADGTGVDNSVVVSQGETEKGSSSANVTVTHKDWELSKRRESYTDTKNEEGEALSSQVDWHIDITLPDKDWTEQVYYDVIQDAEGYTGSHYGVASTMNTRLEETLSDDLSKVSYTIEYFSDADYQNCVAKKTDSGFTYLEDFNDTIKIKGFKVIFKPAVTDARTLNGQVISFNYKTTADYTGMSSAGEYNFINKGSLNEVSREGTHTYTKVDYVEPTLSKAGGVLSGTTVNYESGSTTVDYVQNGNKLYYRLLVSYDLNATSASVKNSDLIIKDELPAGAFYGDVSDIVVKYRSPYGYEWETEWANPSWEATIDISKNEQTGRQILTVTCPGGKWSAYDDDIVIYYTVTVDDWDGTDREIVNSASLKDGKPVTQTTTVTETKEVVSKFGVQYDTNGDEIQFDKWGNIIGNVTPSNRVKYTVNINTGAETLNEGNILTLTDSLSTASDMEAYLDTSSVKLYYYSESEAENKGAVVDTSFYTVSYEKNSEGKYVLTVSVPDSTAFILEYEYSFDWDYESPTVSNSVSLNGKTSSVSNWVLKKSSASGEVFQTKVTVTKVDEEDITRTLPGAEFRVEYFKVYDDTNGNVTFLEQGEWVTAAENAVTGSNGELVFVSSSPQSGEMELVPGCIYRLTETKAPSGYSGSGIYYFAVRSDTINELADNSNIYKKATEIGFGTDITESSIEFLAANGGSFRIANTATAVSVRKIWQDYNGYEIEHQGTSVSVQLYRYTDSNNVQTTYGQPVELNDSNDWSYIWENLETGSGNETYYYTVKEVGETNNVYTSDGVNYSVIYNNNSGITSGEITIINRCQTQYIDLTVNKVWKDSSGNDAAAENSGKTITFTLKQDGTAIGTYTLSSSSFSAGSDCRYAAEKGANGWQGVIKNLPAGHNYTVEEEAVDGYEALYGEWTALTDENGNLAGYSTTITNQPDDKTSISVEKKWKASDGGSILTDEQLTELLPTDTQITFRLYGTINTSYKSVGDCFNENGTLKSDIMGWGSVTVSAENGWKADWNELPAHDDEGKAYIYWVAEESSDYSATAEYIGNGVVSGTVTVTNTIPVTSITVEKKWWSATGIEKDVSANTSLPPIKVRLFKSDETQQLGEVELGSSHAKQEGYDATGWRYTWSYLPAGTYYVEETALPEGYDQVKYQIGTDVENETGSAVTAESGTIIVNNYEEPTGISVEKVWSDGNNAHSDEVTVQLYQSTTPPETEGTTDPEPGTAETTTRITVKIDQWLKNGQPTEDIPTSGWVWMKILSCNENGTVIGSYDDPVYSITLNPKDTPTWSVSSGDLTGTVTANGIKEVKYYYIQFGAGGEGNSISSVAAPDGNTEGYVVSGDQQEVTVNLTATLVADSSGETGGNKTVTVQWGNNSASDDNYKGIVATGMIATDTAIVRIIYRKADDRDFFTGAVLSSTDNSGIVVSDPVKGEIVVDSVTYYYADYTVSGIAGDCVLTFERGDTWPITGTSVTHSIYENASSAKSVTVTGYTSTTMTVLGKNASNGTSAGLMLPSQSIALGDTVSLGSSHADSENTTNYDETGWGYTWKDLPKTDKDGNTLYYYVKEISTGDYTTDYSYTYIDENDPLKGISLVTVTNTPDTTIETLNVSVRKDWSNYSSNSTVYQNYEVTVYLLQNGTRYGTAKTLSADNNWNAAWTNLPDGYSYSVQEVSVRDKLANKEITNYSVTYSNNPLSASGEIVIINTSTSEGYTLPETGGSGTWSYTIGGLLLSAMACLLLYIKNKRGKEEGCSS